MNCVPKRWSGLNLTDILSGTDDGKVPTGDLKQPIFYRDSSEGLVIECVVAQPPSARGRTVYVHIRNEEVEWLLKELRDVAIRRRARPMSDDNNNQEQHQPGR